MCLQSHSKADGQKSHRQRGVDVWQGVLPLIAEGLLLRLCCSLGLKILQREAHVRHTEVSNWSTDKSPLP